MLNSFLFFCAVLLAKALVMVWVILNSGIGLGPDEAQYWTWSQDLAWGYYSKPPAVAWQIWLGTQLLGNTELGVRFFSIILSSFLSLGVYGIAIAARTSPNTALWAGLIMALSPLGFLSSLFATTDVGMVLFWSLACIVIVRSLSLQLPPNYYLLGFLILCGALFKWPIYLIWALVLVWGLKYRFFYSRHLAGGIALSLIGLLPSMIWNVQHEWATFRHVGATLINDSDRTPMPSPLLHGNFWEFLAAQAGLLSPVFFGLLLIGTYYLLRRRREIPAALFFCGMSCVSIIFAYSLTAIFKKMQGNWCVFAYPQGIVFLCWFANEYLRKGVAWLFGGLLLSLVQSAFVLSVPYLQSNSIGKPIPYSLNLFKHNVGWDNIARALENHGYNPAHHFLFGDKYQTSSILSFYGPDQKRAYFLNLQAIRKNQFSFWPGIAEERIGQTGFFVHIESNPTAIENYKHALHPYFEGVQYVGSEPLYNSYGKVMKTAFIFKCVNCNGKTPDESGLY